MEAVLVVQNGVIPDSMYTNMLQVTSNIKKEGGEYRELLLLIVQLQLLHLNTKHLSSISIVPGHGYLRFWPNQERRPSRQLNFRVFDLDFFSPLPLYPLIHTHSPPKSWVKMTTKSPTPRTGWAPPSPPYQAWIPPSDVRSAKSSTTRL